MEILSMNVVVSAIVDPWVTTFYFVVALAMRIQAQLNLRSYNSINKQFVPDWSEYDVIFSYIVVFNRNSWHLVYCTSIWSWCYFNCWI